MDETKQTLGQQLVSWNPKGYDNPLVGEIKSKYAEIIDTLDKVRNESEDPQVKRLTSTAITQAEIASMCAVKAVTWSK